MSTETETKPATSSITFTRGGLHILRALLKEQPLQVDHKVAKASRLGRVIRKANPTTHNGFDLDKRFVRDEKETDSAFQARVIKMEEAFAQWQDETVALDLTEKQKATAKDAIDWALKNRDKVRLENNDHLLSLLEGFGLDSE